MREAYIKHLAAQDISGMCFRVLLLLNTCSYTQSYIAFLLNTDRQAINKVFLRLEHLGLIEVASVQGKNKFYRAVTDLKRLRLNEPGQMKLI